ncbi:MAG: D-alanine--D-alanine ligase [Chloroherpetonaceae bacterium]|nr:D-alanine--D-alanine ligase [Chloroherpetonaceae bacterium]MDW8438481.1 D-alanine--D-alanine ligase family protein [Chloroherpetonaceae bacterium]
MKKTLALLFGGRSGEHEISIISARSVANAVDRSAFHLLPIYITREGKWLSEAASRSVLERDYEALVKNPDALAEERRRVAKLRGAFKFDFSRIDVVFPVLHGTFGEDGTVQGLLEMMNVPYVGNGVLASALTMDKAMAKAAFKEAGLNVVDYVVAFRREIESELRLVVKRCENALRYPMFVKPANLGSSVGVSKAKTRAQLEDGLKLAARYDRKVLIEQGLDARELEVAVLGNDELQVSVVGEIVPCNEFYDYEAKYVKSDSKLYIPAPLPKRQSETIRKQAAIAFKAAGCEGMARVDFFLEKGANKLFINEINAIPGFTSISMYPKMFLATGVSYPELISRLIELAFERFEETRKNQTSVVF